MNYRHFTTEQRYDIAAMKGNGCSNKMIAEHLGKDPSSIGRELRRNRDEDGGTYRAGVAERQAVARRSAASGRRHQLTDSLQRTIDQKLRDQQWSPEQISNRLQAEGHPSISTESIYLYVWRDKRAGGDLYLHLRQQKKRRKRYGSHDRRGMIPNRVSIDERPAIVDERSRIGDWEIDTVIGAQHKGAIVTSVERRTRYLLMRAVRSTTSVEVTAALTAIMQPHQEHVLTITADNGREFTDHPEIARKLGASVYFAHPYHSWERGTNENTNGLVRQYFPKGTSLLGIDDRAVRQAQEKINNRPRKTLGWKSAREALFDLSLSYFPKKL